MRSVSVSSFSPLVGTLIVTCTIMASCLLIAGCGRSESRADARYGLTTGSVGSAAANNPTSVIVQPNDTLYGIARRYNVTVYDLVIMNDLTSQTISAGQRLYLPTYGE
jgi:LysM repeat protein